MAISDPVAVYTAHDNVEADVMRIFLQNEGIEAFAIGDDSVVGLWWFGPLTGIHKPQVWVNRSDAERARQLVIEYEDRQLDRRDALATDAPQIEVVCEECGKTSWFPAAQRDTTQDCPFCHAYVDVGVVEFSDEPLPDEEPLTDE